MSIQPPDPALNGGRQVLAELRGEYASVAIAEVVSDGITRRDWTLSLPGKLPVVKPFTSLADMKADLKAILDELRLANEAKQTQQEAPEEEQIRVWPVVRFEQQFLSSESARVSIVATFLREEDALSFAETREDLAVLPNAFKDVKPTQTLVAFSEPDPKSENARKLNRIIQGGLATEPEQEAPLNAEPKEAEERRARPGPLQEDPANKSFRPVPVETPPTPSMKGRVWAAVRVIGTHGLDGALFRVVQLYDNHRKADLATMLTKDVAVFPTSFAEGEFVVGQWFAAASVEGYPNDANAKKIRKLVEAERATSPQQRPTNPEPGMRQDLGHGPSH